MIVPQKVTKAKQPGAGVAARVRLPGRLVLLFVFIAAAMLAGAVALYYGQRQSVEEDVSDDLATIVTLKADAIVRWRAERLGDGSLLMETPGSPKRWRNAWRRPSLRCGSGC